jgi:hypothetical protein
MIHCAAEPLARLNAEIIMAAKARPVSAIRRVPQRSISSPNIGDMKKVRIAVIDGPELCSARLQPNSLPSGSISGPVDEEVTEAKAKPIAQAITSFQCWRNSARAWALLSSTPLSCLAGGQG